MALAFAAATSCHSGENAIAVMKSCVSTHPQDFERKLQPRWASRLEAGFDASQPDSVQHRYQYVLFRNRPCLVRNQKASPLMISLPLRVPTPCQVARSMESLTNLTEPSQKPTLTPPG